MSAHTVAAMNAVAATQIVAAPKPVPATAVMTPMSANTAAAISADAHPGLLVAVL